MSAGHSYHPGGAQVVLSSTTADVVPCPDGGSDRGRVVLVPVGALDRRAVLAARYASLIPAAERRAVHVAVDRRAGEELYLEWMYAPPAELTMDVVADTGGIAASIASAADEWRTAGASEVVVLVGQLTMRGFRRWLMHDSTAVAISAAVQHVPATVAILLAVGRRS